MYNQSHFAEVWKEKLFGEWRKDEKKPRKGREPREGGENEGQKEKERKRDDWREMSVFLRQGVMVCAVKSPFRKLSY